MDDLGLRRYFLAYFSCLSLTIALFIGHPIVLFLGIFVSIILSYALPPCLNLISSIYVSLIYGFDSSSPSYESQFYRDDMDKAQRLLREEDWNKAITVYREIIRKSPKKGEPRFSLARIYQKVGYLGLALSEYQEIVDLKNELGRNHVYVLESERSIKELKEKLSDKIPIYYEAN